MRLQFDIMGTETVLVGRTDSEAATLITSNIDYRDHAFIIGATNPNCKPLVTVLHEAEQAGKSGAELQAVEDTWLADAGLKLYGEAVADALRKANKTTELKRWEADHVGLSHTDARQLAKSLGVELFWDCRIVMAIS